VFYGTIEEAPERGCTRLKRGDIQPKPRKKREGVYGKYHQFVSNLPCALIRGECKGTISAHHIQTVGAGGIDAKNEVPLCMYHHTLLHQLGQHTFAQRYELDLEALALAYWNEYMRRYVRGVP
jgi:hypothetical protein